MTHAAKAPAGPARPFSNRRGSIAAYTALMLTTLVGFAGFAIDAQRAWLVQTRLKTAIDAAALAAARDFDGANRDANARAAFFANLNPQTGSNVVAGATISNPVITQLDNNRIRITATGTIPKTLFRVISSTNLDVGESSVATRQATGMELAIVLDATGSMGAMDSTLNMTKMAAAKSAVGTMLDVLYGGADSQRYLWVSVVPFSRTVNIGTSQAARALLETTSMPAGWNINNWSGCVEARTTVGNYDMNDAAPTTAAGRFRPYFWASTYQQVGTTATGACSTAQTGSSVQAYSGSGARTCFGDNDWTASGATISGFSANPMQSTYSGYGVTQPYGPNLFCSANPILPLTASRSTVNTALSAVQAPAKSGGTTIPVGMHAAWLSLSPNWRGSWPGADASLPLDYNTTNMRKVVVLLSDGANNWEGFQYSNGTASTRQVLPDRTGDLYYNAYGRPSRGTTAGGLSISMSTTPSTTRTNANTALNNRLAALCTAMKAAPYNITIFVIGFEVGTAADRTRLQTCASSVANHYFESPSASQLQSTFRTVGNRLASLRLSE